jgi:biotin carboxyl carrier protein
MEVNTRIQVEHRVSELCYSLKFTNPKDKKDFFIVESLVEAMALLARHKKNLPKPERIARFGAGAEARLNATDDSLSPNAGGVIRYWSEPLEGEIRDDQGICMKNPDTGLFMRYNVAGAYDSNIALLLTKGVDRSDSYNLLSKVICNTKIRGTNLATNLDFHYGLVNWFIGRNVMAKPTTRFVVPYLTLVGLLKEEANKLDPVFAFLQMKKHYAKLSGDDRELSKTYSELLDRKGTMLTRPMEILLKNPHMLSGWLSLNQNNFSIKDGKVVWLRNPMVVMGETYEYLNMAYREGEPAAEVIWSHDNELLQKGLSFYEDLRGKLGLEKEDYFKLNEALQNDKAPKGFDADTWSSVRSAHAGFTAGMELFSLIFLIGDKVNFFDLKVEEDLEITIPDYLTDPDLQDRIKKVMVPPPATKADEVVAPCGGMYYGQEAPGLPPFVHEGMHFDKDQPLFIIEVMKMFNKVPAPFAGTIDKILIEGSDGVIVQKGQPLFKVSPDEKLVEVDPKEVERIMRETTGDYLKAIL